MSIEKMSLVTLRGEKSYLDEVLLRCISSGVFHPEMAGALSEYASGLAVMKEENPYASLSKRIVELSSHTDIDLNYTQFDSLDLENKDFAGYIDQLDANLKKLLHRKRGIEQIIGAQQKSLLQLRHLVRLGLNFDSLFACRYLKLRFGRLPQASYNKLKFHAEQPFVFFSYDNDGDYHWCLYICAAADAQEIDGLFSSLYFERIRIPDYAHGTPEESVSFIETDLKKEQDSLRQVSAEIGNIISTEKNRLTMMYSKLRFLGDAFEMRKYAAFVKNEFVVIGYIPLQETDSFSSLFHEVGNVLFTAKDPTSDERLAVPVRLKNNSFIRPFEMFVDMYGLPGYKDIDPTPFVAATYILLFGIMFGDLGQGFALALLGLFLYKKKKMVLGGVMSRIGLSSMVFGFLYGSVFGNEELLIPIHQAIFGRPHLIEVMAGESTNFILMAAVGVGALITMASILFNIILGLRQRDLERAVFSHNGLAGLVFYIAVIYAAVATLFLGQKVLTPVYIIFFLALPLVLVFLKEPLGKLLHGKKDLFPEGIVSYVVENFFELFDVLLSFVTNTMSFLRVGSFILVHAGMMIVVATLAQMVGAGASIVVLIIGNIFVMAMEGLIVGIQVLRLEFYEIFSRFFDGDGEPFAPAVVNYSLEDVA